MSNDGANTTAERLGRGVITVVPVSSNVARVYPFQVLLDASSTGLDRDSKAQAEQVLLNLKAVLEAAGSDMSRVLKTTVFLADMNDYAAMNEVYKRHFKEDPPARSAVQVAKLPANAKIEIEAVAVLK